MPCVFIVPAFGFALLPAVGYALSFLLMIFTIFLRQMMLGSRHPVHRKRQEPMLLREAVSG